MQQGHRRRYSRRRRRRIRQLQLLVAACILVTGVVLACTARHRSKQEAKEAAEAAAAQTVTQELELDEPPAQNPEPEEEPELEQDWDEEARYMAQACFGEGWICQSKTEWAAIYWNILNRVGCICNGCAQRTVLTVRTRSEANVDSFWKISRTDTVCGTKDTAERIRSIETVEQEKNDRA